jgi:hypothetical protein
MKMRVYTLENVKFDPELWIHLFSIGNVLEYGDGKIINLSKRNMTLTFDKVSRTKNDFLGLICCQYWMMLEL